MTEDLLILGELIAEQAAHMDAAEHRLLTNIREFDRREGWVSLPSCAKWLSWRLGWSVGTAREHVRVAKALGSLPHIDEALRLGKVSYCKVRAMTRVATPANEQLLLMDAELTAGWQLERVCRKYRQLQRSVKGATPADDDAERYLRRRDLDNGMVSIEAVCLPEEAALIWAAIEQATKQLVAARQAATNAGSSAHDAVADASAEPRVACSAVADVSAETLPGAIGGSGGDSFTDDHDPGEEELDDDIDDYEAECAFFERLGVRPEPRSEPTSRPHDSRNASARTATPSMADTNSTSTASANKPLAQSPFNRLDGLLALMRQWATGNSSRTPVEIVVTVSADALANRVPAAERIAFLDDDGCISAEAARRMSCDAGIVTLVEDEHGHPPSVGRRTRSIPSSIGRALRKRDKCCRFPGCTNRVYVDGHHLKHWALGGETALHNLVLLCGRHHKFVHEYGYRVEMDAAGTPRFFDPQGRPAVDIPARIMRDDLGWDHLVAANRGLDIEPHVCGWTGEPVSYDDVCSALYRVDAGLLTVQEVIGVT